MPVLERSVYWRSVCIGEICIREVSVLERYLYYRGVFTGECLHKRGVCIRKVSSGDVHIRRGVSITGICV